MASNDMSDLQGDGSRTMQELIDRHGRTNAFLIRAGVKPATYSTFTQQSNSYSPYMRYGQGPPGQLPPHLSQQPTINSTLHSHQSYRRAPYPTRSVHLHHGQHDSQRVEVNPGEHSAALLPQQPNVHSVQPVLPSGTSPHQSTFSDTTTPELAMEHSLSFKILKFGKILGKGAHGIVSSVTFAFAGGNKKYKGFKRAAAKLIPKEYVDEAHTMQALDHSNIVRVLGIVDAPRTPGDVKRCYIIMEKGKMSLIEYLQDNSPTRSMQGIWALDICKAVKYVHDQNIVHRDIKPENVIYFHREHILKLTDFGISEKAIATKTTEAGRGTFPYLAPEVESALPRGAKGTFSKASDIYSLGLLLWQLFSKDLNIPIPLPPDIPDDFPESLKVMLPKTWETDPHKRPCIQEIISAIINDNSF